MKRIDHSTRLIDAYGPGRDGFTEGHPGVTPPTALTSGWFGNVQEEIARAIELLGAPLDGNNMEQLGQLLAGLEGRVTATEARTLQDAFERSIAAGNSPTIKLKASDVGVDFTIYDSTGRALFTVDGDAGSGHPSVAVGGTGWDEGLWVRGGATFAIENATFRRLILRPSSSMAANYDITFPPGEPPTKAVMRAAGANDGTLDWVAMDWGDTNGGGSEWTPTVSGESGSVSAGAAVVYGTWTRVGNVLMFALRGTMNLNDTIIGSFDVELPISSAFSTANDAAATGVAIQKATLSGRSVSGTTRLRVDVLPSASGAAPWNLTGQCRIL